MHNNELSVTEVESWLRNNPDAEWIARHDMIARLRELKEKLTIQQNSNEIKSTKI